VTAKQNQLLNNIMKKLLGLVPLLFLNIAIAQKADDLFKASDTRLTWLGVDFSHVKLIGDFSQFGGAGEKSASQVKKVYFPAWNMIVLDEREKYDVAGMLRKDNIVYDIDMMMLHNAKAPVEEMETYNEPSYSKDDIKKFVHEYKIEKKDGIGILFVAECLNKARTEAWYHFVAIDMNNNEILVHDRIRGEPKGMGLRNYWAGSINDVIKKIEKDRYKEWKSQYAGK
jgi:hypothetical protein